MNSALPGGSLIDTGLQDLRDGRKTIVALLVAVGAPRLRRLGFELPDLKDKAVYQRKDVRLSGGKAVPINGD
jgi:hypothetical protein